MGSGPLSGRTGHPPVETRMQACFRLGKCFGTLSFGALGLFGIRCYCFHNCELCRDSISKWKVSLITFGPLKKKNRLHIIFLATIKNKIALVWFSKPKPRATSHLLEKKKGEGEGEEVQKRGSEWITPSSVSRG